MWLVFEDGGTVCTQHSAPWLTELGEGGPSALQSALSSQLPLDWLVSSGLVGWLVAWFLAAGGVSPCRPGIKLAGFQLPWSCDSAHAPCLVARLKRKVDSGFSLCVLC